MQVGGIDNLTFKYSHFLKTYWLQGKLPSVKKGLYGGKLTPDCISLEHIKCKATGGHTTLYNLALATKTNNHHRGCQPLRDCLTQEQADEYLDQFKGVALEGLNGELYRKIVGKKIKKLLN